MDQQSVGQADNTPRDDEFAKGMHGMLSEAAERVTFHRIEVERWERIGRAATQALQQLQNAAPVAGQAPDGFLGDYDPGPAQPTAPAGYAR